MEWDGQRTDRHVVNIVAVAVTINNGLAKQLAAMLRSEIVVRGFMLMAWAELPMALTLASTHRVAVTISSGLCLPSQQECKLQQLQNKLRRMSKPRLMFT